MSGGPASISKGNLRSAIISDLRSLTEFNLSDSARDLDAPIEDFEKSDVDTSDTDTQRTIPDRPDSPPPPTRGLARQPSLYGASQILGTSDSISTSRSESIPRPTSRPVAASISAPRSIQQNLSSRRPNISAPRPASSRAAAAEPDENTSPNESELTEEDEDDSLDEDAAAAASRILNPAPSQMSAGTGPVAKSVPIQEPTQRRVSGRNKPAAAGSNTVEPAPAPAPTPARGRGGRRGGRGAQPRGA